MLDLIFGVILFVLAALLTVTVCLLAYTGWECQHDDHHGVIRHLRMKKTECWSRNCLIHHGDAA